MVKFKIAPYKMSSNGAKVLKARLEEAVPYKVELVPHDYVIRNNEWIINWGNGNFVGYREDEVENTKIINPARKVCLCINKVDFFKILDDEDVSIPKWTIQGRIASKWIEQGLTVYCRTDVEGRDGRGIVIARKQAELEPSRLYTVGIEADKEYRVHIFKHMPIFDLVKVHDNPTKENMLIRSGSKGWEYDRHVTVPESAKSEAMKASRALNMDFCAVDLLYNTKTGKTTILEANSAPELGPWTSKAYVNEFIRFSK